MSTGATGTIVAGDGCRIAYRLEGRADGAVLMLSNSLGTTMEMWRPQMAALRDRFRVLRYDSRGNGGSDVPPGAYSLDRLGRDAIELLDALGIAQAHFCGLSKGGMIGQWLGYRAPERLGRLILCNTSAYMGPPSGWDDRIAAVRSGGMAAVTEAVLERWFTSGFRASSPEPVEVVREMLLATPVAGYAGCCAAIRDMDLRPMAPLIGVPTLVIGGTADPATPPEHATFLANAIKGAELRMLDAAHLSNVEQPAAFTAGVLDFLS